MNCRSMTNVMAVPLVAAVMSAMLSLAGCAAREGGAAGLWEGTMDTLPSGRVAVTNPAEGIWERSGTPWRIEEAVRIGAMDGTGPEMIGAVGTLEVDLSGRIWVLEQQVQELRVFDAAGRHVRTIGRRGGGPGEFNQVIGMAWGPDRNLWVVDPQNNRISVIDTAGVFVRSHPTIGGFVIMPWPGGFDDAGHFYTYVPLPSTDRFRMALVKYDSALSPMDTIVTPRWEGPDSFFELRTEGGFMRSGVPFSPGLVWRLAPSGNIWFALTGEYRLFDMTQSGDTLREIARAFEPLPVTEADIDSAIGRLEWFTRQGGKVDRSRFPSVKPALEQFWIADDGTIWVMPVVESAEERSRYLDAFDPEGRYLGRILLPFTLSAYPPPVFRRGMLYGVTRDDLEVPYVVAARVVRP
jgi:hypothetical protein